MSASISPISLRRIVLPWPPIGTTVIDKRGMTVDVSGSSWSLPHSGTSITINWNRIDISDVEVLNAIRRHFAYLVETQLPISVNNAFEAIAITLGTTAFRTALESDQPIPFLVYSEAKSRFGPEQEYRLHYWRKLYRWCTIRKLARFSQGVRQKLDEQTIGGNVKGSAVRSASPDKGPLTATEVTALVDALRAARLARTIPVDQEAAIWLCLACGANPGQIAAMHEEDLVATEVEGGDPVWTIRVPRHKKTNVINARDEFKTRRLTGYIGRVIAALIENNRKTMPLDTSDPGGRALFRAARPRFDVDHPMAEWRWHGGTEAFTKRVKIGVQCLEPKSRDGSDLQVTTRRFRYTLATRLVASGASRKAVAEALDHSDLQNVNTYFDVDSGIVDLLDSALAIALAPRAQALLIVKREEDAVRGGEKGSRCYFSDRQQEVHEPVGTCGNNSYCNVVGPLACYTCRRFQPWLDGPHDAVLDFLIARRLERQEQGQDAKMVMIEDNVIYAVGSVIKRIDEIRSGDATNG